ncbi:sensor domain-containing phosphodiesterase [Pararhizobium mangrovi]|nr:EAL domain-containing protein [Pararhizobium mangrovi]
MPASTYQIPDDETLRIQTLRSFASLSARHDEIVQKSVDLVARQFGAPIAIVTLFENDTQCFASSSLFDDETVESVFGLCSRAVLDRQVLFVEDACNDARFCEDPCVTGEPAIRFYAGAPLIGANDVEVGALSIVDTKPRFDLSETSREILGEMASLVMLRIEDQRLESMKRGAMELASATPDGVIVTNVTGGIDFWNPAAERIFERKRGEAQGQNFAEFIVDGSASLLEDCIVERSGDSMECEARLPNGQARPIEVSATRWEHSGNVFTGFIVRDASQRKAAAERIWHMAHHDALTGLANRTFFNTRVQNHIEHGGSGAVLYVDMDDFKVINDTLGHHAGDELLRAFAERLSLGLPPETLLARLGGDEFAILVDRTTPDAARALATTLLDLAGRPFEIDGKTLSMSVSAGIAMTPEHGETSAQILHCADIALYEAKRAGRGSYHVYDLALDERTRDRHALGHAMREALQNDEFELYYQPFYEAETLTLVGYEALIRWNHPERGLVPPGEFIPVAEETGFIHVLGEWVLKKACREAITWPAGLTVSVNLSPVQFRRKALNSAVTSALSQSGLPAHRLELEITETVLLDETMANLATLKQLKSLGVRVSLDDFGVGYSSLSYLRTFPFDKLKIDRSFVNDLGTRDEALAIVRAVTGMGRSLGIKTTAEGVETEEQYACLREERCSYIQGYLFGRPQPVQRLAHLKDHDACGEARWRSVG